MTKDQIIARLMLELGCCIEQFKTFDDSNSLDESNRFIDELNAAGYKSFPPYLLQSEKDKEAIKTLLSLRP